MYLKEIYLDGRFIKVNHIPIIDFLKFEVTEYPFYSYLYSITNNELLKPLTELEPTSDIGFIYKKIGKLGIIYSGKNSYIYTHYGKHLSHIKGYNLLSVIKQSSIPILFKRIDVAYDLYGVDLVPLILKSIIQSKKRLPITMLSYDHKGNRLSMEDKEYESNIQTIYIGSLKSKFCICIYKKHLLLGVTGPITRIEIRFKKKEASNFFCLYQHKDFNLNSLIRIYLNKYISFKVPNSSKSSRLSRHKTVSWWLNFLSSLE